MVIVSIFLLFYIEYIRFTYYKSLHMLIILNLYVKKYFIQNIL